MVIRQQMVLVCLLISLLVQIWAQKHYYATIALLFKLASTYVASWNFLERLRKNHGNIMEFYFGKSVGTLSKPHKINLTIQNDRLTCRFILIMLYSRSGSWNLRKLVKWFCSGDYRKSSRRILQNSKCPPVLWLNEYSLSGQIIWPVHFMPNRQLKKKKMMIHLSTTKNEQIKSKQSTTKPYICYTGFSPTRNGKCTMCDQSGLAGSIHCSY